MISPLKFALQPSEFVGLPGAPPRTREGSRALLCLPACATYALGTVGSPVRAQSRQQGGVPVTRGESLAP